MKNSMLNVYSKVRVASSYTLNMHLVVMYNKYQQRPEARTVETM